MSGVGSALLAGAAQSHLSFRTGGTLTILQLLLVLPAVSHCLPCGGLQKWHHTCPALDQVWSLPSLSEGTGAAASGVAKATHILQPLFWSRYPWALTPCLHCLLLLFCSRENLSFRGWLLVFFSLPHPESPFNWIITSFRRVAPF